MEVTKQVLQKRLYPNKRIFKFCHECHSRGEIRIKTPSKFKNVWGEPLPKTMLAPCPECQGLGGTFLSLDKYLKLLKSPDNRNIT